MRTDNYIKAILYCTIFFSCLTAFAQKESRAKEILDKTSTILSNDNGIKATFLLNNYRQHKLFGQTEGTIFLKGNRFILKTQGTTTWFNGKTQWTYITDNDEINISYPTEDELQTINPYSFINLYKKGFTYKVADIKQYKGKKVYNIILTPENKKQDISQIELYIEQTSLQPTFIKINSDKGEEMTIEISSYKSKLNLPDDSFTLDIKKYPNAEIIDLR